jgi:hypothetical protein
VRSSATVWVVACVLAVAGCDGELAGESAEQADAFGVSPDAGKHVGKTADAGAPADSSAPADAGAVELPRDAAVVLADAAPTPDAAVDAALPVPLVVDAAAPVSEPAPRCTTLFYRDADHDSFGDPATALASCARPDGYVANARDCFDGNANAKPGQTGRFDEHRGDGSFDYDCDGVGRAAIDYLATCPALSQADRECYPSNAKPMTGDPVQIDDCYNQLINAWQPLREGWWLVVPRCGEQGYKGWNMSWSREASYQCVPATPGPYATQVCN